MKYLSLFLPTTTKIPKEKSWKLWFEEFMTLWQAFSNAPSWEEDMFELYSRLAFDNIGFVDWTPYVDIFFTKFMCGFGLPTKYGEEEISITTGKHE